MSLTIEGDPSSILNKWPLLLDTDSIKSLGIAWIFTEQGKWKTFPRFTGVQSLFYNAAFFLRVSLPFGIFFGMRLGPTYLFQCGIGWKLNGRFAILFRVQTDASAAAGVSGPNYGQSPGYEFGTH
jgi:hypothetical protein